MKKLVVIFAQPSNSHSANRPGVEQKNIYLVIFLVLLLDDEETGFIIKFISLFRAL